MRILMINTESGWRGGEHQVQLLVTGLAAQGEHEVITVCQPASPLARALAAEGGAVIELAMHGPLHLGAIAGLRRIIRERAIDLVHAHTSHGHGLAVLALIGSPIPLVVTRRVDFRIAGSWPGRWKYTRRVRRFAAVSHKVAGVLAAGGVPRERIQVIMDGIDFQRFADPGSTLRQEFRLPSEALVFGIVAHLTDHKDHRTLLRAFSRIHIQAPQAWLFIIGGGELDAELRAMARERDLRRVVFTGFRTDIANCLRGLDVFILSSHHEGLGSSIMDAMYCGLPVIATQAGGIPELLRNEEEGLLVPPRDPEAMAQAMLRMCQDGPLRRRLAAAAGASARRRFGAGTMIDGYLSLYRQVAAES
jgi:glycosyltransferase involved in cell wall biosynthesis